KGRSAGRIVHEDAARQERDLSIARTALEPSEQRIARRGRTLGTIPAGILQQEAVGDGHLEKSRIARRVEGGDAQPPAVMLKLAEERHRSVSVCRWFEVSSTARARSGPLA